MIGVLCRCTCNIMTSSDFRDDLYVGLESLEVFVFMSTA